MKLRVLQKTLAASLVASLLAANQSLAEEERAMTPEASQKVEALNAEIQALTEQLEQLTSQIDSSDGSDAEEITEEAEDIKDVAADIAEAAADIEEETKLWTGSVEFGFVDTNGNTEETSTKSRAEIFRETEDWKYTFLFSSSYSQSDGINTAEKYFLANRLSYKYNEKDYIYGYHSYDDDRFSGFDYITTFSMGYGRTILDNDTMEWNAEIGPGYRYSKVDDEDNGEDSEEAVVRMFTNYIWDFAENSTFTQGFNVEAGEDNTISNSRTALEVKVIGEVSIVLSYTVKYKEEVPADTKHADTETAVTVSYSF
ncbi:DUF481 domain-containing protein [Oceanicoccus sagamiensis]|uniref:DUF481 domain-containing protein n=1 Tax=Oceanicoccus sagamiensis TaxID=716816 RepID=A0A1X9NGE7_9GAMM|nr:DUF481 domain-containing protein [Oceanicoccus sagamiensis]ARN74579.1 hypothetical protein BST96_10875 [Oceanicoccus sagamiensis]